MRKSIHLLSSVLALATVCGASFNVNADDGLSSRSLQKLAREGDPSAAVMSFSDSCATVRQVTGREFLWKSQISHHIPSSDPRASGPTFICNQLCPLFPMSFFYSDGTRAGQVGYYGTWSATGKARAYCAAGGAAKCSISTINSDSRKKGRDGFVYLQLNRKAGKTVCYKVRPLGRTGNPL